MKNLAILITALSLLCACAPRNSTTIVVKEKTPEEMKTAAAIANELVPLILPKLAESKSSITPEQRAELVAILSKNMASKPSGKCLMDAGMPQKLAQIMEQKISYASIRTHIATAWAKIYTVSQLQKATSYIQSRAARMAAAQWREMRSSGDPTRAMTIIKQLHDSGKLTDAEVNTFMSQTLDPDLRVFMTTSEPIAKDSVDKIFKDIKDKPEVLMQEYVATNGTTFINCTQLDK